jgi:hypothetical protein
MVRPLDCAEVGMNANSNAHTASTMDKSFMVGSKLRAVSDPENTPRISYRQKVASTPRRCPHALARAVSALAPVVHYR